MIDKENLSMSHAERQRVSILVVDPDKRERNLIRSVLTALGYGSVYFVSDHVAGIRVTMSKNFTHLIFAATDTNMPADEFLTKILEIDPSTIAIPSSFEPQIDDVFELLRLGARGFLVKPICSETIELAIVSATKGDPFSEAILNAKDRNEAFSALIASNLDKVADDVKFTYKSRAPRSQTVKLMTNLISAVQLSKTFAKDGEKALLSRMTDFFIELAQGPATRLGRLRNRLKQKRSNKQQAEEAQASTDHRPPPTP